jgi:SEC-C motif-containing protein
MTRAAKTTACPCGSARAYEACCARLIERVEPAGSALELMRSRYTAYALGAHGYVQRTWHPSTRPAANEADPALKWIGLEVLRADSEGDSAMVEFVARYKINGRAQRLHEISRFVREDGQWYYLDGSFPD